MRTVALARNAMATRFELLLHGDNEVSLRSIGEEVLTEVERLENQLSLYRPGSEISRINARAAIEPVQVSPPVFALLKRSLALSSETNGAFDITIAPLVRCWGFMQNRGRIPTQDEIEHARSVIGFQNILLDPDNLTVRFARPGMMIDLGAIGKGYAVDCGMEILREAGVTSALLHGGTSTVFGLGKQADGSPWKVAIDGRSSPQASQSVVLCDESLSVSAVWGREFVVDGKRLGHVIDPRTGWPVNGTTLAAVVCDTATETDALSTALLVGGETARAAIAASRPSLKTILQ